jgi:hypothetical protein
MPDSSEGFATRSAQMSAVIKEDHVLRWTRYPRSRRRRYGSGQTRTTPKLPHPHTWWRLCGGFPAAHFPEHTHRDPLLHCRFSAKPSQWGVMLCMSTTQRAPTPIAPTNSLKLNKSVLQFNMYSSGLGTRTWVFVSSMHWRLHDGWEFCTAA